MLSEPVLFEQDKRSDTRGIRSSFIGRNAAVVRTSSTGSGNHVSKPWVLAAEDLRVIVVTEDI